MKNKMTLIGLFAFLLLVVSGCFGGGSSAASYIECSLEEEEFGMVNSIDYKMGFDASDKATEMDMTFTIDFVESTEEEVIENYEMFEEMYSSMDEDEGISVSTRRDGTKIIISMFYDLEVLADEASDADDWLGFDIDEDISKEEFREMLIDEGFTCN